MSDIDTAFSPFAGAEPPSLYPLMISGHYQLRRFCAEFLREQRSGTTHDELSTGFNALLESVSEVGKGGTLTLVIKVKPAGKGDHHMVVVSDTVTIKMPEGERGEAIFFVDDDFNLSRDNPRQPSLPLREVPRSGKDKAADPEAGEDVV